MKIKKTIRRLAPQISSWCLFFFHCYHAVVFRFLRSGLHLPRTNHCRSSTNRTSVSRQRNIKRLHNTATGQIVPFLLSLFFLRFHDYSSSVFFVQMEIGLYPWWRDCGLNGYFKLSFLNCWQVAEKANGLSFLLITLFNFTYFILNINCRLVFLFTA